MLIKSTFKDYYDSAAGVGIDTSVMYVRETRTIQLDDAYFMDNVPAYFPQDWGPKKDFSDKKYVLDFTNPNNHHCQFTLIGFCGTLHVGLFGNIHEMEELYQYAYFGEDILTLNWSKQKTWRGSSPLSGIENCLKQWHGKKDDTYFKKLKTPIFTMDIRQPLTRYEMNNLGLYMPKFTVNPPLSILQFYKAVDPYSAFQSIQSYVSGVLGTDANPMIEVSNNTKILKAGFDLKTSFRKDKEK
jgi:hypothetical protein